MRRLVTVESGAEGGVAIHRSAKSSGVEIIINVTAYNVTTKTEPILGTFISRVTGESMGNISIRRANYVKVYRCRPVIRIARPNGRGIACIGVAPRGTMEIMGSRVMGKGPITRFAIKTVGSWKNWAVCHSRILIYNNANYASSGDTTVVRTLRSRVGGRNLRGRIGIMEANYFKLYTHNPVVIICPRNDCCSLMGPRSIPRVIRRRLLGNEVIGELLFRRFAVSSVGSLGRASFCGGRRHITLHGYNIVSPRGVGRCVTCSNCTTLTGYLSRCAPTRIVSVVSRSKLENENNNNFPANGG